METTGHCHRSAVCEVRVNAILGQPVDWCSGPGG